jgi:taspase, threonine aspartase, 1
MLTGEGARNFAMRTKHENIGLVESEDMISPRARNEWQKWISRLETRNQEAGERQGSRQEFNKIQDTVGAVAVSASGSVGAGVSR